MQNSQKKEISAILTKNEENEIVIRFNFEDNNKDLNLQSNNSEEIKVVFLELSKKIRVSPIEIKLEIVVLHSENARLFSIFLVSKLEYGGITRELATTGKYTDELPRCTTLG